MIKLPRSSANPEKVSLTVRGILTAVLPTVLFFTGLTSAQLEPIVDVIVDATFFGTALLSTIMTGYGLVRRLYNKTFPQ